MKLFEKIKTYPRGGKKDRIKHILKVYMKRFNINTEGLSNDELISLKKSISSCIKEGRNIQHDSCCRLCGACGGLCRSHTVPEAFIKNISEKGYIIPCKSFLNNQVFNKSCGVGNAGIFKLICQKCDNELFQKYENITSFCGELKPQTLNQIALKNYLSRLYAIKTDIGICETRKKDCSFFEEDREYISLLIERRKMEQDHLNDLVSETYHLLEEDLYKIIVKYKLDYVVPIAYQGAIPLITGLDGEIINDLYSDPIDYTYLNVVVFPLGGQSIVLLFVDKADTKYDKFGDSIRRCDKDEKNKIINKIVLWYSNDFFVSGLIDDSVNKWISTAVEYSPDVVFTDHDKSLYNSVKDFDLRRDTALVSLLDESLALRQ